MTNNSKTDHCLVRASTIRWLWRIFVVVLALTVLAQFVLPVKGYFGIDSWFGFGAVYGFVACLLMVLFAKLLGVILKRPQDYYQEREDDA